MAKSNGRDNESEATKESTKAFLSLKEKRKRDIESMRDHLAVPTKIPRTFHAENTSPSTLSRRNRTKTDLGSRVMAVSNNKPAKNGASSLSMPRNGTAYNTPTTQPSEICRRRSVGWPLLRCCFVELPMGILFSLLLTFYCLRELHEDYFVPFLQAAARTDDDLETEFTYYDRICGVQDISTHDLKDLVLAKDQTTEEAVDTFLTHGALVVPKLLSQDTVQKLRRYVKRRNDALTAKEALPVSQGRKRKSFTIDATEDPILPVALKEIASHPQFQPLMEGLLGEDPGLSEITAITSFYGAIGQAWHPDVKPDGSPMKFARTYAHSYSVFIPLQDTTKAMGATEYLPGTHFCGDADDMYDLVEEYGMSMSEASPDHVWHSGDAAIVSQQAWHRGGKPTDPDAPERIVFVVTFISRPNLTHDRRQLSRGTYFHMRWNMWGHSLRDMLDAERSMAKPYSILRCLHLWKPSDRNYGFDFLTSSVLRMANNQDGACVDDLPVFVESVVSKVLPTWLQGRVTENSDAWPLYFRETFGKCFRFLAKVNLVVVAVYVLLVFVAALVRQDGHIVTRAGSRMLLVYGTLSLLGYRFNHHIRNTEFAKDIRFGRLLKRLPSGTDYNMAKDQSISAGPTTAPDRLDVLVGTRYDARFLGAFDRFLDHHLGNVEFQQLVRKQAGYYTSYLRGLPEVFPEQVLDSIVASVTRNGRFVQQDYRTGVWRVMSLSEAQEYTRMALLAEGTVALGKVEQEMAYLVADHRLGLRRETRMAREALSYLFHLKRHALFPKQSEVSPTTRLAEISAKHGTALRIAARLRGQPSPKSKSFVTRSNKRDRCMKPMGETDSFQVGDAVLVQRKNSIARGSIEVIHDDGTFDVKYDTGKVKQNVSASLIHHYIHVEEGTRVSANFKARGRWYPGVVVRVRPSLEVDIQYDDGDSEEYVPYWLYEVEL